MQVGQWKWKLFYSTLNLWYNKITGTVFNFYYFDVKFCPDWGQLHFEIMVNVPYLQIVLFTHGSVLKSYTTRFSFIHMHTHTSATLGFPSFISVGEHIWSRGPVCQSKTHGLGSNRWPFNWLEVIYTTTARLDYPEKKNPEEWITLRKEIKKIVCFWYSVDHYSIKIFLTNSQLAKIPHRLYFTCEVFTFR